MRRSSGNCCTGKTTIEGLSSEQVRDEAVSFGVPIESAERVVSHCIDGAALRLFDDTACKVLELSMVHDC